MKFVSCLKYKSEGSVILSASNLSGRNNDLAFFLNRVNYVSNFFEALSPCASLSKKAWG
jgi:hypothetical protein